jgi:hypothetical protein
MHSTPNIDSPILKFEIARLYTTLKNLAGIDDGSLEECREPFQLEDKTSVVSVMYSLLRARKSGKCKGALLYNVITLIVKGLPLREVDKLAGYSLQTILYDKYGSATPTFYNLAEAYVNAVRKRRIDLAIDFLVLFAKGLSYECKTDIMLRDSVERSRKRMLKLGVLLGLTLPALFILSLLEFYILSLLSLILVVLLWAFIRKYGFEYRTMEVELAWRECDMTRDTIIEALSPPRLPALKLFRSYFGCEGE